MSDVIVSTNDPITTVTTTDNLVEIAITNNPVEVSASTAGVQGASYNQGDPIYVTVRNASGATLPKGTIVYISGANGNNVRVTPAIATSDATSARTLGWLAESIANNASGLCQIEGYLEGLDTQGLTAGSQLYLSGTVAGAFQVTKPQAPIHLVYVGVVTKVSAGDGHVFVKVQNGYELDELHNVQITSVADGDVLEYDSATSLWKNRDLTTAGIAKLAGGNAFTGSQTITSTTSGEFPLSIISASGQTASTFRVRNSANNADLMSIDSSGQIRTSTILNPNSFNNSRLQMQNTGVFIDTGVTTNVPLAVRGSSGQTADLVKIQNSSGVDLVRVDSAGRGIFPTVLAGALTASIGVQMAVQPTAPATPGFAIRGAASQTANLQEWQDSAGTILGRVNNIGEIVTSTTVYANNIQNNTSFWSINNNGMASFTARNATNIPMTITGASAQTADLLLLRSNGLTTQFRVDPNGMTIANSLGVAGSPSGIAYAYFNTPVASAKAVVVRSAASQTASVFETQDVSGSVRFYIDAAHNANFSASSWFQNSTGRLTIGLSSASAVGLTVRGAASQSANLQEWQNSAGTIQASIDANGMANLLRGNFRGAVYGTGTYFGAVNVLQESGGHGVVIQGRDSQTTDLLRIRMGATPGAANDALMIQNSAGSTIARIDNGGNLKASNVATLNTLAQLAQANSGGVMIMGRATAQFSSPGANSAALYFRDGTNAGTLKLVVRAGAAGAETTILDNIPQ